MCSQGAVCCTHAPDDAFQYLKATNDGRVPDDVVRALAVGMAECENYVRALGQTADAQITTRQRGGETILSPSARPSTTRQWNRFRTLTQSNSIRMSADAFSAHTSFAFSNSISNAGMSTFA